MSRHLGVVKLVSVQFLLEKLRALQSHEKRPVKTCMSSKSSSGAPSVCQFPLSPGNVHRIGSQLRSAKLIFLSCSELSSSRPAPSQ